MAPCTSAQRLTSKAHMSNPLWRDARPTLPYDGVPGRAPRDREARSWPGGSAPDRQAPGTGRSPNGAGQAGGSWGDPRRIDPGGVRRRRGGGELAPAGPGGSGWPPPRPGDPVGRGPGSGAATRRPPAQPGLTQPGAVRPASASPERSSPVSASPERSGPKRSGPGPASPGRTASPPCPAMPVGHREAAGLSGPAGAAGPRELTGPAGPGRREARGDRRARRTRGVSPSYKGTWRQRIARRTRVRGIAGTGWLGLAARGPRDRHHRRRRHDRRGRHRRDRPAAGHGARRGRTGRDRGRRADHPAACGPDDLPRARAVLPDRRAGGRGQLRPFRRTRPRWPSTRPSGSPADSSSWCWPPCWPSRSSPPAGFSSAPAAAARAGRTGPGPGGSGRPEPAIPGRACGTRGMAGGWGDPGLADRSGSRTRRCGPARRGPTSAPAQRPGLRPDPRPAARGPGRDPTTSPAGRSEAPGA